METPDRDTEVYVPFAKDSTPRFFHAIRFLFVCVHALFASRFSGFSFTRKIMFAINK